MQDEQLYTCACHSSEHIMIFRKIDEDKTIYVDIHLSKFPFWKRVIYAFKYIFDIRSKYGAFEEIILTKEHSERLIEAGKFLSF